MRRGAIPAGTVRGYGRTDVLPPTAAPLFTLIKSDRRAAAQCRTDADGFLSAVAQEAGGEHCFIIR